jgi:hypothetical protein
MAATILTVIALVSAAAPAIAAPVVRLSSRAVPSDATAECQKYFTYAVAPGTAGHSQRLSQWKPYGSYASHLPSGFPSAGGICSRYAAGFDLYSYVFLNDALDHFRSITRFFESSGWTFYLADPGNPKLPQLTMSQLRERTVSQLKADDGEFTEGYPPGFPANTRDSFGLDLQAPGFASATPGVGRWALEVDIPANWNDPPTKSMGGVGFNRQSFISDLKSITNAVPSARQATAAAGGVVVLSLIVGYPAFLLNRVITGRYESWRDWVRTRWKKLEPQRTQIAKRLKFPKPAAAGWTIPRWTLWPAFMLAGIFGSIDDPDFGFTLTTLRTIITLTLSIAIFNIAAWSLTRRVLRHYEPNIRADIDIKLSSIGILIASVILSRLLDFSPGVVFGTVAGLVYAIELGLSRKVVVILTGTGFSAAIAIVAWVAYTLFAHVPGALTNGWLIGITEVFGGITITGVSAAPLALLPLAGLDGEALFTWRRVGWGITYSVVLFLFVVAMFDLPQSFTAVSGDVIRWLILFGVFAAVAVGVWLIDAQLRKRAEVRQKPGLARVDKVG